MSERDRVSTALADFVRHRIETKGWSIRQTAAKAGISPVALSKLLRGVVVPRVETLQKLAPTLNVEVRDLLQLAGHLDMTLGGDSERAVVQVANRLGNLSPPMKAETIKIINYIMDLLEMDRREQLTRRASAALLPEPFDQQWETTRRPDDIRVPVNAVPQLDE